MSEGSTAIPAYEQWRAPLSLRLPETLTADVALMLPMDCSGSLLVPGVMSDVQLELVREEYNDPASVAWRDNHVNYMNARDMFVDQRHEVFAVKLRRGDQRVVERAPRLRAVAANVQAAIQQVGTELGFLRAGRLQTWEADEMSLHRYDDPEVGLSFHKDNARFFGLIAVIATEGEKDFASIGPDGVITVLRVQPGDMVLNRSNGLYEPRYVQRRGKTVLDSDCPDHGVYNVTPPATSFIVRANSRPDEPIPGFTYDNWDEAA